MYFTLQNYNKFGFETFQNNSIYIEITRQSIGTARFYKILFPEKM